MFELLENVKNVWIRLIRFNYTSAMVLPLYELKILHIDILPNNLQDSLFRFANWKTVSTPTIFKPLSEQFKKKYK